MAKPDDSAIANLRPSSPLFPRRTPPAQPAAGPPPAIAPAPALPMGKDKNNAMVVMSPPPAAATRRTAPVPAPTSRSATAPRTTIAPPPTPAAAPAPEAPPPRCDDPDTLTRELDAVFSEFKAEQAQGSAPAPARAQTSHGVATAEDLAAVRTVFEELSVSHVANVRDVMLELRYGDADPRLIETTKPALRSLRAMAEQLELGDLCEALDAFCAAVDTSVANRANVTEEDKAGLQRRYSRLIELIPQAFELDAERDRREPIIVEALLYQVPGVERPTIEKLFAVGLGRLEALMSANASEVAAVTGLRPELATAIVEQFRSYRATVTTAVSAPDPGVELNRLGQLLVMLSLQNDDFVRASSEWSEEAQQRKRGLRKQREQTFQQIKVSLARLGQREQLQRLEKLPFQDRIATLDQYLSSQHPVRPSA